MEDMQSFMFLLILEVSYCIPEGVGVAADDVVLESHVRGSGGELVHHLKLEVL
jgi:hypothetical protein